VIGLDTNVLVRFLVQDDARQANAAAKLIARHCSKEEPGRVSLVVLCELVWVLSRAYRFSSSAIGGVIENLLQTAELDIENADTAWAALRLYRLEGAGFADAVTGLRNRHAGCQVTATFDAAAARLATFSDVAQLIA
jgi:predicted nucleic-acid-binding protein